MQPHPVPVSHPIARLGLRPDLGRDSEAAAPVQPDQCKPAGQNR